jgi:integrase
MRGVVRVPQPKRKRIVSPPGPEAVWRLADALRAAGDEHGRILVLLMGFAGLRPEEALGLEWESVGKRTLFIGQVNVAGELRDSTKDPTRDDRSRTVDLIPALEEELVDYRLTQGGAAKGLVLQTADGKPWGVYTYRNWRGRKFSKAAAGTGLSVPYDLRHSYASLLIHEGQSVVEVAEQLGHAPAVCLSTYAHVMRELKGSHKVGAVAAVKRARRATLAQGQDQNPGQILASQEEQVEAQ